MIPLRVFIATVHLLLCVPYFWGCLASVPRQTKPSVSLSWNDKATRLGLLARDLGLLARVQPRGSLPYSHNASTAVWVGVDFPYDKAIPMIRWARNYYHELRYFALSDYVSPYTARYDNDLFIGGSTRKALKLGLQAWTKKDFRRLKKVKSLKQLHALIRSRYPKSKR